MSVNAVCDDVLKRAAVVGADVDRDEIWRAEGGREDLVCVAGRGVGAGAGEEGEVGKGRLPRELVAVGAAVLEAGGVGGAAGG